MGIKGLLERVGKVLPEDEPELTLWSTFRKQSVSRQTEGQDTWLCSKDSIEILVRRERTSQQGLVA